MKLGSMALVGLPFSRVGGRFFSEGGGAHPQNIPARYYQKTPRGIRCQLCPNRCELKEGERGDCRTRINIEGTLYTLAYGNPCAVHIDPIEKKPLYHFLPGTTSLSIATAGCNLACLNCQNWEISQKAPDEVASVSLMPDKVASMAHSNSCRSVSYTYTDPVVFYEYVIDSAKAAHDMGLKNVIVSAGFIEESPLRQWCRYIDAANIDLKSFSDELYQNLNAGFLKPVLNTLNVLKEEGVWLEITNLIVPRWTDDPEMIRRMCGWLTDNGFEDVPLHFSRFTPTYKLDTLPVTPLEILDQARDIALKSGLRYVYVGNVPGHEGKDTYCPNCKKKLIDRSGFRLVANHISENRCSFCGESIAGVWC